MNTVILLWVRRNSKKKEVEEIPEWRLGSKMGPAEVEQDDVKYEMVLLRSF